MPRLINVTQAFANGELGAKQHPMQAQTRQHPMLYSSAMVQAILAGRKTMTRRLTGLSAINLLPNEYEIYGSNSGDTGFVYNFPKPGDYSIVFRFKGSDKIRYIKFPYGNIGDVIWVREKFQEAKSMDSQGNMSNYAYAANGSDFGDYEIIKWRPSIHMPRAACRLFLRITDVRVERLQDISEGDAIAEGIEPTDIEGLYRNYLELGFNKITPKFSFQSLWEKINGYESWAANPWVFAISFERIEKP